MPAPVIGTSRYDLILSAVMAELEGWKPIINDNPQLETVIVTVHLRSGHGHPREVECTMKTGKRIPS